MCDTDEITKIEPRYLKTLERIRIAKQRSGRDADPIRLVVVTKGHSLDMINAVIAAGARDLGENYVQEAESKIKAIDPPVQPVWHMIGHIQSRKAALVAELFPWVQSVDSLKLARRLDRFAGEQGAFVNVLLEYNVSGEGSKFGWDAADPAGWEELSREVESILELPHLRIRGLMTMAPFAPDPEYARGCFQSLRMLSEFFKNAFGPSHFSDLSMGMTQDFEVAVEEGATILRIGQAIMGPRPGTHRMN